MDLRRSESDRPLEPPACAGGTPVRGSLLPLMRPWMGTAEAQAASDAVARGHLAGDGPEGHEAEAALGAHLDGAKPLLMTSCTSALEAAILLAGVGPGDEVVLPSFTFVSCANAVVRAGARPVFADIDPSTLNVDPDAVARAISSRTKAIIIVHYAGRACDMARLLEVAESRRVRLIEDAAHGLGARWAGRPLGTIGDFGCFSFHGTKDIVCGEGGALVCRDEADTVRAEILREKGTNRAAFLRGEVDKYTWVAEGGSLVASDVLAAVLRVQIGRLPAVLARKRALAATLGARLAPIAGRVVLPEEWPGIQSSWHLYPVLVPVGVRDAVLAALRAEGIGATFHYIPLHDSPYAREHFGYRTGDLPHTERVSAALVRLPLFAAMSDADLEDVGEATLKVVTHLVTPRAVPHGAI
jgi:dTDP-4-amino-4,6-dideoxygalactose transaminase